MSITPVNYTEVLKMLRAKDNISQSKMAEKMGITRNTYHSKEIGKNEFTLSEIKKIGEIFNTSPVEIFFEVELPNGQLLCKKIIS